MALSYRTNITIFILSLHLLFRIATCQAPDPYEERDKCDTVIVKECQDLLYNLTKFPNFLGHVSQDEARMEIQQFLPLININCSPTLKLFLCSLYFPICANYSPQDGKRRQLPPCKSLCEQNRVGCEPIMKKFNFKWPSNMHCNRFPENLLCVKENKTATPTASNNPSFTCPAPLKVPPDYDFAVQLGRHIERNCGIPCNKYFFNDQHSRRFARLWIGLWSCLCVASTLFTVLTFLIDMKRFQYPERPIIFLSACYFMVALTYVAGFILNDQVACSGPFPSPDPLRVPQADMPRLITQGTKFEGCIILFMLLYFFSMASSIWWVILTLTWYLAAKCHWAHEAIAAHSQYFHFAAWALPAAKTIGILASGRVDGDPLSGVCFTGLSDVSALRGFVIAPLCIYLVIGTGFLIAGFVSLFKIRTIIKTEGSKTDKLEKLIVRIGVFSVLYIVPAVIVIACYFHESTRHAAWMQAWYTDICRAHRNHMEFSCALHEQRLVKMGGAAALVKPEFELFMIKYLMSLIVGITSGIWIWSGKTLLSWQRFVGWLCRFGRDSDATDSSRYGRRQASGTAAARWTPAAGTAGGVSAAYTGEMLEHRGQQSRAGEVEQHPMTSRPAGQMVHWNPGGGGGGAYSSGHYEQLTKNSKGISVV